jgi:histidinol-phosphatase (PHP family)
MLVDYHTHTGLSKHGSGSVEDFVRAAIALGLYEIACTEHSPMPDDFDLIHRITIDEYEHIYAPSVAEARERFKKDIVVRRSIEADFFPGTEAWMKKFIDKNDFDFVIGSVHFLGEWGFDDPVFIHGCEERDINQTYVDYYKAVKRSAESRLFDVIAHCDLVKKFGHRPRGDVNDILRETFKAIHDNGCCIELNTSGLRKPAHEIYPGEHILQIASEFEIPMTIGSDAHRPEEVGFGFAAATALIEKYAKGKISIFEERQRKEVRIS